MTNYTQVTKPSQTDYSTQTFQGKQTYDDPTIIYNDVDVFYDSVNVNQYTTVSKPTQDYGGFPWSYINTPWEEVNGSWDTDYTMIPKPL